MPAIGINISVHYCVGEIVSVSIGSSNTDKCVCGSKKMKKNCCQNKNFSFKLKDNQQKEPQFSLNTVKSFDFRPALLSTFAFHYQPTFVENVLYNSHHPPNNLKQPLYILNQVFRI